MIYILIPLFVLLIGIGLFTLYIVASEFKPAPIEESEKIRNTRDFSFEDIKTITTFNLGYCALDKDQDFFLEGGKNSRKISRDETFDNLLSLTEIIKELNSDFILLQEVDTNGKRSSYINQVEHITTEMNKYNLYFAYNYHAKFIPLPLFHPMGSVHSGMLTLSKQKFLNSTRISLEGQNEFPRSLFYPKRCMVVNEFQINRNKKLIVINIHLSAYDKEGIQRSMQISHILKYITNLYNEKENCIIVGGDFNLLLDKNKYQVDSPEWVKILPKELYDSDFRVIFDNKVNTVRSEDAPYMKGRNFETIVDGYIISPNLTVSDIKCHNLGFKYTDHNPVTLSFQVK